MNLDCRFDAICELYPETGSVENGVNVFDKDGKKIEIDESKVTPVYEKKLAEFNALEWERKRQEEYPNLEDCIHALLDGGETLTALQTKRTEVKNKYPKS
tara:strand:+ start:3707 stop:4006 length:300 start_codon:yes stop_codon:yes gene_type:complete